MRSTVVAQSDSGDHLYNEEPHGDHAVELRGRIRRHAAHSESERPTSGPIRVLLVIDMNLVRGAFAALLSGDDDMEVVAGLALGEPVLSAALRLRPDVTVLDIEAGEADGLTVIRHIHEQLPACRVVALASARRPGLVRRALDVHVAGAVDKDAHPSRLPTTIRRVADGQRAIDPALAVAAVAVPDSPLTRRELAVLGLAAGGASQSEIAGRLFLSPGTVRNYLSRVVSKTGARSRIDAIRIARDAGWL